MNDFQPCEIEIRVNADGGVKPLRFTRGSIWVEIMQIGRAWTDHSGDHWLVTPADPDQIFELLRSSDGRWQVRPTRPRLA